MQADKQSAEFDMFRVVEEETWSHRERNKSEGNRRRSVTLSRQTAESYQTLTLKLKITQTSNSNSSDVESKHVNTNNAK